MSGEVAGGFLLVTEYRRCIQLRRFRYVPLGKQVRKSSNVVYHVSIISLILIEPPLSKSTTCPRMALISEQGLPCASSAAPRFSNAPSVRVRKTPRQEMLRCRESWVEVRDNARQSKKACRR